MSSTRSCFPPRAATPALSVMISDGEDDFLDENLCNFYFIFLQCRLKFNVKRCKGGFFL